MYQMQFEAPGGPEVLVRAELDDPVAGAGEVLVRHEAVGFNMIDTYHRKGLYPLPMPAVPGIEAAGVVEAIGDDVEGLAVGDRVVYMFMPGSYCDKRVVPANLLIKLPDSISSELAAASFMKGLTVWALATQTYALKAGDTALVYAATGGVGTMLCQWALHLGANVIAVVGNAEKAAKASALGCQHVIDRSAEDVLEAVKRITDGQGVNVVYDSLGQATFDQSLDCLARLGTMVSYGNATGPVEPVNILMLMLKGSLTLVRPQVNSYVAERHELEAAAAALFAMLEGGHLQVDITQRIPLTEAALAHERVESAQTTGSTILLP